MSEIGAHAAVGIENVEWLTEGTAGLTVRVTGRWRRRRGWVGSEARGPTTLMIEAGGQRHRFPAMPEPPSLAGVAPGTWRLSFAVPAELTPGPDGRAWLSLGSVTVPLPLPACRAQAGPPEPSETGQASEPPPPPRTSEPPPPPAAAEAPELGVRVRRLEQELAEERRLRGQASESIAGARIRELETRLEAARRAGEEAERSAAAARLARERAERQLAGRAGPGSASAPARSPEREQLALEDALRVHRHTADLRVPAEPAPSRLAPSFRVPGPAPHAAVAAGAPEQAPVALPPTATVAALRRELAARAAAEAGLRARVVAAEARLAARVVIEQRTAATLRELGTELTTLRLALESERARRETAEAERDTMRAQLGGQRARSREASAAIDELRGALDRLAPGGAGAETATPAAGDPAPAVTPERLSDALARLRESTEPRTEPGGPPAASAPAPTASPPPASPPPPAASPPPSSAPARTASAALPAPRAAPSAVAPARPTLEPAVRRLARRDAARAGRVVVSLVGAQRAVHPGPLSYDLVLGPGHGCVQVTVDSEDITVQLSGAARAREQVDLQLIGDPARIARRLLAGPLRRLAPIGLARARGRRDGLAALRALLGLPLDLRALREAGMRADPESLLALVAAMIEPAWTRGERFTLAHTDERGATVQLQIRDGRAPRISAVAPDTGPVTTLTGPVEGLFEALVGEPAADATPGGPDAGATTGATLEGDPGRLSLLRTWIDRAQCG